MTCLNEFHGTSSEFNKGSGRSAHFFLRLPLVIGKVLMKKKCLNLKIEYEQVYILCIFFKLKQCQLKFEAVILNSIVLPMTCFYLLKKY